MTPEELESELWNVLGTLPPTWLTPEGGREELLSRVVRLKSKVNLGNSYRREMKRKGRKISDLETRLGEIKDVVRVLANVAHLAKYSDMERVSKEAIGISSHKTSFVMGWRKALSLVESDIRRRSHSKKEPEPNQEMIAAIEWVRSIHPLKAQDT